MDSIFEAVLYLVIAVALVQSLLLLVQSRENRRFATGRIRKADEKPVVGRVAVFVPCKGLDLELAENLRPLFEQDHDNYELIFIIEDEHDPAWETIRNLVCEYPRAEARVTFVGRATESGQKVHNLRMATSSLSPRVDILAFVDSDARPRTNWLRLLTHRLDQPEIGAATGYRWFVPARPTLTNWLLYSINASVAALLGPGGHHLLWGGSWAIRREVFESCGLNEAWYGTLSDDLVASQALRRAGLRIEFEPGCMLASPLDVDGPQLFEFLRRQYVMGRFYAPLLCGVALLCVSLTNLAFLAAATLATTGLIAGDIEAWLFLLAAAALLGLPMLRGLIRRRMARVYLPEHFATLRGAIWFDVLAAPLVSFVNWLGLVSSRFGHQVVWRGVRYQIFPGGQIRMLLRLPPPGRNEAARLLPAPKPPAVPMQPAVPILRDAARCQPVPHNLRRGELVPGDVAAPKTRAAGAAADPAAATDDASVSRGEVDPRAAA